jgi:hypothetical protein
LSHGDVIEISLKLVAFLRLLAETTNRLLAALRDWLPRMSYGNG